MQRNERQEKIIELVRNKQTLKIIELSQLFGVSEMTIHRDVKPLIEQGVVMKIFGGIALATKEKGESDDCVVCYRKIQDRLSYRLILSNNQVESACCAHCGLIRHAQCGDQVVQALCYDFLTHTTISCLHAWYVVDTSFDLRCCQPQALPFGSRKEAEQFVKGFGGSVLSFEEATEAIQAKRGSRGVSCHE